MNKDKNFTITTKNGNEANSLISKNGNEENGILNASIRQNTNENLTGNKRVEIYLTLQSGFREHGWKWGIDSGDVSPNSVTESTLRELATASAEDAYQENFNPDESLHDRHREEDYEEWRREIAEAKQAMLNEKSKLKETENLTFKTKAAVTREPEFPIAIVVVAIPLITLTVAFALYDSFVGSLGFVLALTFSLLAGLCWGAFISYLILHKYHSDKEGRNSANWFGLIAGIGMAVALGFIRFSQSSPEFLWLVIGLTLLEIFIVLGLEFFARNYRHTLLEYQQKMATVGEAQSDADATAAEIIRREDRVNKLQNKIDDHLLYLNEREIRAKHKEQFIASAEKAVIEGYRAACAKNKGISLK